VWNLSLPSYQQEVEKRLLILLLFILCGCRERSAACTRFNNDDRVEINIKALNDDIRTIEVVETFVLPYEVLADERSYQELLKQMDKSCYFEDNKLIRRYGLPVDGKYSLSKTIEYLRQEKYYCE